MLAAQQRGVETSTGTKPAPIAPSSSSALPADPIPVSARAGGGWDGREVGREVMEGLRRSQPSHPGAAGAVAQGTAPG